MNSHPHYDSVNSYLRQIGKESVGSGAIDFIDDYVLDGYGAYNNDVLEVIREVFVFVCCIDYQGNGL